MLVKTFDPSDVEILKHWLDERGVPVDLDNDLPEHGYIVYEILTSEPIACGFLRVQKKVGFIEGMTTNPKASSKDRNDAMDELTSSLLNYAKRNGINKVFGYSVDKNIVKRAERHGFVVQPHVMFSVQLGV